MRKIRQYSKFDVDPSFIYRLVSESGPDHAKQFDVEALIGDRVLGHGSGSTKKAAEQEAAYEGLMCLHKEDSIKII